MFHTIGVQQTHCHVLETSLEWHELCDMVHYSPGSTHQKGKLWSLRDGMVGNNTQAVAFKRCSISTKGPKKMSSKYTTSTSLKCWDFMLFKPNSENLRRSTASEIPTNTCWCQTGWHQQPGNAQSHLNPLSSSTWCSVWPSASWLDDVYMSNCIGL